MNAHFQNDKNNENKNTGINDPILEKPVSGRVKCPNCKQSVEPMDGMCPECRHYIGEGKYIYQPLSPKTIKKVKFILTFVFLGIFIGLVAFGVVKLQACQNFGG